MIKKNLWNAVLVILFLVLLFVPAAKALLIQGLMTIGLYTPAVPVSGQAAESVKEQVQLPPLRLINKAGMPVFLPHLKGKTVFLNFWATWCPPCLAEMPSINKLYQKFEKDTTVVFLMVDADQQLKKAQDYLDKKQYKLPLYMVDGAVSEQVFDGTLPTTLVFDKQGRLAYRGVGAANYADIKFVKFIKELK